MTSSTRHQTLSELTVELGRLLTELRERIDALSDLAAAVQALAQVPTLTPPRAKVIKVDELAHAILLAGGACEATVALAIRQYLEAAESRSAAKRLSGCDEESRTAMVNRWKRQLHYYTQTLIQLGVQVVTPKEGEPIDPDQHEVVDQLVTHTEAQNDTVATVLRPAFHWRDAQGCPQVKPARVTAYELVEPAAAELNGVASL